MNIKEVSSRQFFIFLVGGLLTALIDVGTLIILLNMDIDILIATTGGFILAFIFNYTFHSQITFRVPKTLNSVIRFLTIVALSYLMTVAFVILAQCLDMHAVAGKLISLPFVALSGYFLSKYWAFG